VNSKPLKLTVPERAIPSNGNSLCEGYPDWHANKRRNTKVSDIKIARILDTATVLADSGPQERLRHRFERAQPLPRTRLFRAPDVDRKGALVLDVEFPDLSVRVL
jgi:hypothetical protein